MMKRVPLWKNVLILVGYLFLASWLYPYWKKLLNGSYATNRPD